MTKRPGIVARGFGITGALGKDILYLSAGYCCVGLWLARHSSARLGALAVCQRSTSSDCAFGCRGGVALGEEVV